MTWLGVICQALAAGRAFSVEHVPEWCAVVRRWAEMQCMANSHRWELNCHDSGGAGGRIGGFHNITMNHFQAY